MTETGKRLMSLLRGIYDDDDFVCGTMSNCGGEAAWEKMLAFIMVANERGEPVTSDDVLALSLVLGEEGDTEKGMVRSA